MCLIVKDQHRDVVEWIQHHRALGAEKFYVFDHNSSVPLILELHPLVNQGIVQYEYFRCGLNELQNISGHKSCSVCGLCSYQGTFQACSTSPAIHAGTQDQLFKGLAWLQYWNPAVSGL